MEEADIPLTTLTIRDTTPEIGAELQKLAETQNSVRLRFDGYTFPPSHRKLFSESGMWRHPSCSVAIFIQTTRVHDGIISNLVRFLKECPAKVCLEFLAARFSRMPDDSEAWTEFCDWISESHTLKKFVWRKSNISAPSYAKLIASLRKSRSIIIIERDE